MRILLLPITVVLLASPVAFAQQPDGGAGDKPAAATGAPAVDESSRDKPKPADAPPLRDDYEPREKISKDKAESFPPDI